MRAAAELMEKEYRTDPELTVFIRRLLDELCQLAEDPFLQPLNTDHGSTKEKVEAQAQ
jgi:hypothetical protein